MLNYLGSVLLDCIQSIKISVRYLINSSKSMAIVKNGIVYYDLRKSLTATLAFLIEFINISHLDLWHYKLDCCHVFYTIPHIEDVRNEYNVLRIWRSFYSPWSCWCINQPAYNDVNRDDSPSTPSLNL